jgi:hypothetical protein
MADRRTTTQRGLGHPHKQRSLYLRGKHVEGTLCWWCGEPMYLAQGLHADHSVSRAVGGKMADRLLHGPCNEQRGDGHRDADRPAITGVKMGKTLVDVGLRTMRWPS